MKSVLSTQVIDRGKLARKRATFIVVHNTGSTNLKKVINFYKTGAAYPHYLIDYNGDIYNFCDELKVAAHAAWPKWETNAYANGTWKGKFQNIKTGKVENVEPTLHANWVTEWNWGANKYKNPLKLVKASGGRTPNQSSIGIELMAPTDGQFTESQYVSLARLVLDIAVRHNIKLGDLTDNVLPTCYLCGHEDVSPCRRYAKRKDGSGFGFDPGPKFDWNRLSVTMVENSDMNKWAPNDT